MVYLVLGCCKKLPPPKKKTKQIKSKQTKKKNVSCMGREIPQGHDNKISRPSASFMIDRMQVKFKKQAPFVRKSKAYLYAYRYIHQ